MADVITGSFVTSVLATAGRLDKDDLNTKLDQLSRKIDEVKLEVHDALIKKYAEFYPLFDSTQQLCTRVTKVEHEMDDIVKDIDKQMKAQLRISAGEFESLQTRCRESRAVLSLLNQLIGINDKFQVIDQHIASKNYVDASLELVAVQQRLKELQDRFKDPIKVVSSLTKKYATQHEKLVTFVTRRWHENVEWKSSSSVPVELAIGLLSEPASELEACVQSLHNLGQLDSVLGKFAERLMLDFVRPLAGKSIEKQLHVTDRQNGRRVVVSLITCETPIDKCNKFTHALEQLIMFFCALNRNLLDIKVIDPTAGTISLMSIVGNHCGKEFLDLLIRDCLQHSVPSNRSELSSFNNLVYRVQELEDSLVECGFISSSTKILSEYVANVEILFANKRCQDILELARNLMMSDIHNIVAVSDVERCAKHVEVLPVLLDQLGTTSKKAKLSVTKIDGINLDPIFRFPQCCISVSGQKLVEMGYEVLREATQKPKVAEDNTQEQVPAETAKQLFYCVRAMFEMFGSIVPVYHSEQLTLIPQLAAVYHNDCMFIAHHLTLLGHQFQADLPEPLCNGAATFVDLIPVLRRSGTKCFLDQMSVQKMQILQSLRTARGFVNVSAPENYEASERAIGQMMHQLNHLVNVWKDVLPDHILAKSIGTLLNSGISEIVSSILSLEDIRERDSDILASLLADLAETAQSNLLNVLIDKYHVAVSKLVPSWGRLVETKFMLKARLQDIVERWSEGKGPLAAEMKAGEVKQLMRALFQNTDKRAAALLAIS